MSILDNVALNKTAKAKAKAESNSENDLTPADGEVVLSSEDNSNSEQHDEE